MAFFTEQMELLTSELLTSRHERDAFVSDVQQRSHELLGEARTFMEGVGREHGAMTVRLRADLATGETERLSVVKALRAGNRETMQTMRQQLHDSLAATRQQREEQVAELRVEFRAAQKELAADLRQAAQVWNKLPPAGAKTNSTHKGKTKVTAATTDDSSKGKMKVAIGITATPGSPPVKTADAVKSQEHGRGVVVETKSSAPVADSHKGKAEEPAKSQDHGRSHAAESKHGAQHGKSK